MGISVKSCLFIIFAISLIIVHFLSTCKDNSINTSIGPTILQIRENLEIDDKFPIVFYNTAYLDYRFKIPRLRVFSMNPCVTPNEYIVVELVGNFGSRTTIRGQLKGEPTEGECPWHWATQCLYNSYIWTVDMERLNRTATESIGIERINIILNERRITLNVQEVYPKKEGGFTVCVQPVYWYSEFHNIALFIETWRAQGATRFVIYFHSSTKEVRQLLEYYENIGVAQLKPWPSFGNLSSSVYSHFQIPTFDSSTYRVGHTLAQNLCVLEINTEIGAIADFDEVMISEKGILIDYVEEVIKQNDVGALKFDHLLVKFTPKIDTMDFSGVTKPIFLNRNGPSKTIFNSSAVDIVATHSVRRFIGNETTVQANGSLLHYRHNSGTENAVEVQKPYNLFPSYPQLHIGRIKKTLEEVYNGTVPNYNYSYLHVLNECITRIVGEGKCRSTVAYCKPLMDPLTDWVKEKTGGIFVL